MLGQARRGGSHKANSIVGPRTEVYDAKIMGVAAGLGAALNSPAINLTSGIIV